eukprot:4870875-Prymnesium_polylepis.2
MRCSRTRERMCFPPWAVDSRFNTWWACCTLAWPLRGNRLACAPSGWCGFGRYARRAASRGADQQRSPSLVVHGVRAVAA